MKATLLMDITAEYVGMSSNGYEGYPPDTVLAPKGSEVTVLNVDSDAGIVLIADLANDHCAEVFVQVSDVWMER